VESGTQGEGVARREALLLHLARVRSLLAALETSGEAKEALSALDRIEELLPPGDAWTQRWRAVVRPIVTEEVIRGARAAAYFRETRVAVLRPEDFLALERHAARERARTTRHAPVAAAGGALGRALDRGGRNPALLTALAFTFALGFAVSLVLLRR
jgi:hypothetical protein